MYIHGKILNGESVIFSDIQNYMFSIICLVYIGEPTKPLSLTATPTGTSVTLSWEPPASSGGREDVFYTIKYKTSKEELFNYYSPTPPITGTSVTFDSLAPLTTYTFMVVAENGVTQGFADLFPEDNRTSSLIFVATNTNGEYIKLLVL